MVAKPNSVAPDPSMVKENGDGGAAVESDDTPKKDALPKASIKKMLSLATNQELLILFIGAVFAVGNGALQPIVIVMWGELIDQLGVPPDVAFTNSTGTNTTITQSFDSMTSGMTDKVWDMCMIGLISVFCGFAQGYCFKKIADCMHTRMCIQYYSVVLHKDVEWFDGEDPASLPLQITADAQKFGEAWGDKLGMAFMGMSTFVFGYILAYIKGWQIALAMTATLPLIAVGASVMGQAMQDVMNEVQGYYAKAAAVAEETLYAIRTVAAFGGEPREITKYSKSVAQARNGGIKTALRIGGGYGYTMCMCFLTYALAFYVGMRLKYDSVENPSTGKPWTAGEIIGVFMCILMGSFMMGTIDPGVKAFEAARVSAARFFEARDKLPAIQRRTQDDRQAITKVESMELQDVHFAYPARPDVKVLNGLSLRIQAGQKVAVVGESGSGKSTVMALLERFYDPTSGQVLVNGQNIQSLSIDSLRKCIGYVGQEPVLFATSIQDNILQGVGKDDPQAQDKLKKVLADAQCNFINELPDKLDTYVGSGGLQMSGGQKQRIAIARALIKGASVLFCDEATSALDNSSEKMIQETIDKISSGSSGLTIVTIAHRLSTVRSSDIIYVLRQGTLVESGNHAALMEKQGVYYALVASQEQTLEAGGEQQSNNFVKQQSNNSNISRDSSGKLGKGKSSASNDGKGGERKSMHGIDNELEEKEAARQKDILKAYKVPMSRILSYCKKEWPFFLPGVLGALYDGASQPIMGVLMVDAIVGLMNPDRDAMRDELHTVCIWYVILSLGEWIAVVISSLCFSILGESLIMRLRIALFSKVFDQEMGFHDDPDNSPGILNAALEINTYRVANFCKSLGNKSGAMSALVVGLTVAFYACWQMALVLLGTVPVMIAANMLQMVVMMGGSSQSNDKVKRAQQLVSESLQNIRTVHACGIEKRLATMYNQWVTSGMTPNSTLALGGFAFGFANSIVFFIMAIAFYVMSLFLEDGTGDFRDLMIAFMSVIFAAMGAGQCASMMGDASKATVAAHDAFQL
jgi:ABC-type multidrug transport system fused ATPase/permease subunit